MAQPKYSSDGKPLNAAARKALNTAIKHSAQGIQDKLKTLGISKTGKTKVSPMANVRGRIIGGGMGGMFGIKNR